MHGAPVTVGPHVFDCITVCERVDCVAPLMDAWLRRLTPSRVFGPAPVSALSHFSSHISNRPHRSPRFVSPLDRVSLVLNSSFMPPRRNPPVQRPARQVMSQSERLTRSSSAPAAVNSDEIKEGDDSGDEGQEEDGDPDASGWISPSVPPTYNYIINDSSASTNIPALPRLKSTSTEHFREWKEKTLSVFERFHLKDSVTQDSKDHLSFIFLNVGGGNTPFRVLSQWLTQQAKLYGNIRADDWM